jgi:hypothetical protein
MRQKQASRRLSNRVVRVATTKSSPRATVTVCQWFSPAGGISGIDVPLPFQADD